MPHLKELHEKHQKDGLVILGIHSKKGMDKCQAYVGEEGIPYAVAIDHEGKTVDSFKVDSFPDYYVVDRAGKLRFADLANAELDKVIETLLAEKAPSKAAPAPTKAPTAAPTP